MATRIRACVRLLGGGDDDATWKRAFLVAGQLADFDRPSGDKLAEAIRTVRAAGGKISRSDVMVACDCNSMDEVGAVFSEVLEAMTDEFCDKDALAHAKANSWRGRGGES
jgi:hypothetical protein